MSTSTIWDPIRRAYNVGGGSDVADLPKDGDRLCRGLWIGGGGNVRVTTSHRDDEIFYGVQTGTLLQVQCRKVWATNTTATYILALY